MRLVATFPRWAAGTAVLAVGFVAAVQAYVTFTHSERTLASFGLLIAGFVVVEAGLVLAGLTSEEARLSRELRTARTGTTALRGLVIGRRQQAPFLTRLFATRLGFAAVLLAEGDRQAALQAMAGGSPLMRGGRLDLLRAIVDADAERSTGTSVGLERCVGQLLALDPTGHREADLYRTHVLVKALLEQGDPEGALEVYRTLGDPKDDDDQQIYATWLRVWFDLEAGADDGDSWPALTEGQLRMATLLARTHGADKLVEMLEARLPAVAQPAPRE
jgi:hypothetical protein